MHLQGIGLNAGQFIQFHAAVDIFDLDFQIGDDLGRHSGQIDLFEFLSLGRHPAEGQQTVDKGLHSGRGIVHALQRIASFLVELFGLFYQQAIGEGADFPERLLQVVRCHVSELLQFAVGAFEFGGITGLFGFGFFPALMSRKKKLITAALCLLADGHGHFGGKTFAVCSDCGHFDPAAQERPLAGVEIAFDALLLACRHAGGKQDVGGFCADDFVAGISKGLLGGPIELGNNAFVIDCNDRVERGFQDGVFSGLRFSQGLFEFGGLAYFAMDDGQGRGPIRRLAISPAA